MLHSEKGVSAVEFALIAPLLFVLTLGVIEFALLLFDKAVITNASREAARAAIVYNTSGTDYLPLSVDEIKTVVKDYANGYLINLGSSGSTEISDGDIDIAYEGPTTPGNPESGGDVIITVTYGYNFLVFPDMMNLLGESFTGEIPIVGTTRMRME
ncbi:TadE/TadG family type IV pilus assembly protein [Desulfogranum mediterraneum]|uniref:TadE/TadG family type IV pilus assembly protein n=1 Tax=Desulfogranum mediterraneum TaxID=160661 RepID=UPI000417FAD6|nr:TadE/TadG family type IV pilus assembly protein [Desulfogranum mediterraneum]